MGFRSAFGISTDADLGTAVLDAADQAGVDTPAAWLVLVTHSYPREGLADAIAALKARHPNVPIAGGTVNGLTDGGKRYDAFLGTDRAVAALAFEGVEIRFSLAPDLRERPFEGGVDIAKAINAAHTERVRGGLIFTPGFAVNHGLVDQDILDGIRSVAPRIRFSGTGLAGGMRPDGGYIPGVAFLDDEQIDYGTLTVTFGGDIDLGHAIGNGMKPAGPGGFVTEVDDYVVKTIDGRPARDVVLEMLEGSFINDESKAHFMKNPGIASVELGATFGVVDPEGDFFWPQVSAAFDDDGGMRQYVKPRVGMPLSLIRVEPESCLAAVRGAGEDLLLDAGAREFDLVISFSCVLRGFTLGADAAGEDAALAKVVEAKRRLGVVANGEIGSHRSGRSVSASWVYSVVGFAGGERG